MQGSSTLGRDIAAPGARRATDPRWAIGFGGLLPLAVFALQGHIGFGKSDESFLWYGVQRVLAGEVPLRDFQAYDIGRYYWSAIWMWALGDQGLVALRFSDALLAAVTVALATALVSGTADSDGRRRWVARSWIAAVTFAVWMVPEYKAADSFATILLVFGLSRLLRDAEPRGVAVFGVCLGAAATIGINHALYGTIGGLFALAYLRLVRHRAIERRTLVALCGATMLGYAPVLFCHAFVPGFAAAFVDSIRMLVEAGATNVPAPFPRPTAVFVPGDEAFVGALRNSIFGSLAYAAPLFLAWCAWRLCTPQTDVRVATPPVVAMPAESPAAARQAVFAASVFLAVPYAHYVVSNAGTMHLAISGLPFVVAVSTFPVARRYGAHDLACIALLPFSLFMLLNAYAGYPLLRGRPLESVVVHGDTLVVPPVAAAEVRLVTRLVDAHPGRRFFAAHDWPGAYAIVGQRAPNWEIYEVFPSRPERQAREIARIAAARPAFVILTDGRPGVLADGLENTHADIARYVRRCFALRETHRDALLTVDVFEPDRPCETP